MKKLKVVFLIIISFYFLFHFVGPAIFYWLFGYVGTYQNDILDFSAFKIGFWLNFTSVVLAGIFIWLTPLKFKNETKWKGVNSIFFLVLAVFFTLAVYFTNLDYFEALKTINTRHDFLGYGEMFFNLDFYILFAASISYNFIAESSLFFTIIKTLAAIRSAPLVLLHLGACAFVGPSFEKYKKKFFIYVIICFPVGILGFKWATKIRNPIDTKISVLQNTNNLKAVKENVAVDHRTIYQIVGRISYLENTMLPVHYKNTNDERSLSIFHEKYSPLNQFKLLINNIVPGDIFPFDVYPNQYYRSAFMNMPLKQAREFYTSINMTLPAYIYMYWNFVPSVLFSAIIIWSYFFITAIIFGIHPLFGICFLASLYPGLLTFFDFVMLAKAIVVSIISAFLFLGTSKMSFEIIRLWNKGKVRS